MIFSIIGFVLAIIALLMSLYNIGKDDKESHDD